MFKSVRFLNESIKFYEKADDDVKERAKDIIRLYKQHFPNIIKIAKDNVARKNISNILFVDDSLEVAYLKSKEYAISIVGSCGKAMTDNCNKIVKEIAKNINSYIKDNNLEGRAESNCDNGSGSVVIYIK